MNTPILDGIRKIAVTLDDLSRANKEMKPNVMRFIPDFIKKLQGDKANFVTVMKAPRRLLETVVGLPHNASSAAIGKVYAKGDPYNFIQKGRINASKALKKMGITEEMMPSGTMPKVLPSLTPRGREAFNRSIWQHENAERISSGNMAFFSHNSPKPMLQDLNIAATLKGSGADAADALRALRANEVEGAVSMMGGKWKDFPFGYKRLSRHAIKEFTRDYERAAIPRAIEALEMAGATKQQAVEELMALGGKQAKNIALQIQGLI